MVEAKPGAGEASCFDDEFRPLIFVADAESRDLLCETFVQAGYRVRGLGSGLALYEALHQVRQGAEPPALVITDQHLPGMSGLSALRLLRDWGWSLPVVLIAHLEEQAIIAKAFSLGAQAVFARPFDIADLQTVVVALLPRRRQGQCETTACCVACGRQYQLPRPVSEPMVFFCRPCFSAWSEDSWPIKSEP